MKKRFTITTISEESFEVSEEELKNYEATSFDDLLAKIKADPSDYEDISFPIETKVKMEDI
jgi:hypothetical protein